MTLVNAVSVTRMPTRSLVRISCAVTSSGVGRVSTFWILTVRPTAQNACRPAGRRSVSLPSTNSRPASCASTCGVHDQRRTRRVELVEVALGDAHLGRGVDALDVDLGDRLPERARRVRQHQVLRLAVERDDGDLVGAGLHDLEVLRGNRRVRLGEQQRLVGGDLGARDLDDLGRQAAAVVERNEAARAEQALEPAIAHEECTLVVLDDNLELEQHDTSPIRSHFNVLRLAQQVAGCRPRRSHGPALEPEPPSLRAWLRPCRSGDRTRRCQALGLGAKGGIRAGAERLDACCSDRHLGRSLDVSWRSWEAAGFPFAWLA